RRQPQGRPGPRPPRRPVDAARGNRDRCVARGRKDAPSRDEGRPELGSPVRRRIRVLVVDDHPVVLAGLVMALGQQPDIELVVSASNREEASRLLGEQRIDVGLVDVRLQNGTGFDLIGAHPTEPGPAWIVLSSFESPQYLAAALRAGAAGYMVKTTPLGRLLEA